MSLSEKSDQEISELLTEYGIKHGPIVGSTRSLYEKKLEKAMKEDKPKPSSDKTYYREEEEEVTYITYHSPVRTEAYENLVRRRGSIEQDNDEEEDEEEEEESDHDAEPPVQPSKASNHSRVLSSQPINKSGGGASTLKRLIIFALLAAVLYFIYSCMESNPANPFQ